jgi:ATP-dependent DNA helicase RecQ
MMDGGKRDNGQSFAGGGHFDGVAFIDTEVGERDGRVHDFGAFREPNEELHTGAAADFARFIAGAEFLCGHNIVHHDLKYLSGIVPGVGDKKAIDTLYLSPLLFPKRPYHNLLKDDKLQTDELNNPLNDALKARDLFHDELNAFWALPEELKAVFCSLLHSFEEFRGFFDFLGMSPGQRDVTETAGEFFAGKICGHADLAGFAETMPRELAYALALINTGDSCSVTPPWVLHTFPNVEHVLKALCGTPCREGCAFCNEKLDVHKGLRSVFGYGEFRLFDGEPMQERAVRAAVSGESLLAIFPTGGGKSLTFQLPALMQGRAVHGLTVVISPLQSLMKDQVDNLAAQGVTEAVTINGLLDPLSRAEAIGRVADGSAAMLYISPEMLRSKTIEKLLLSRNVVRFVIDEAHCFSAWGHDFRVDYLYIGDFIRKLREKKAGQAIPVSCFTATAKQKVISDIRDYFRNKLGEELKLFASSSSRKNLRYSVIHVDTEEEKYQYLRSLLLGAECPAIVYVSRTKRTRELADKLTQDGIPALPFNGKMEPGEKIANQNAFILNEIRAMVATSAFGMGVDKKDVGLVVHYDISDSLENYVQEAGRAGRDPRTDAKCHVLYSDQDLDKHFILLNQTKLSISEIQQVWSAIKTLTRKRPQVACSALEIARQAGWNDEVPDIETRVRTAVAALEDAGYVSRGNNVPHVFATGIMVKNIDEARQRITRSPLFDDEGRQNAIRIIKSLISSKYVAKAREDDAADSRVDYLADILGMTKEAVIGAVTRMRQEGILADSRDMSAFIDRSEAATSRTLERFVALERFLLERIGRQDADLTYKALNERALASGLNSSSVKDIRTLLYFLTVKAFIRKQEDAGTGQVRMVATLDAGRAVRKQSRRIDICRFIIRELHGQAAAHAIPAQGMELVQFSVTELLKKLAAQQDGTLFGDDRPFRIDEIEEALLYLSKIGAMKLEGGFLVVYNAMEIHRLADMKIRYKLEDYRMLDEFYKQKIRQIHIVGEYANLMVKDYAAALQYVQGYFQMDFRKFIAKYFKGERLAEIDKNITPGKYKKLFGMLSDTQRAIINDKQSKHIVVAAGPGSGKTRVLVHKLASLLLLEDVKHEQLLMLTFSRAAATEFKQRLMELIGNAAHFVEIKTFHSYCFDLLGKVGNLEEAGDVVSKAARMIENGEVEPNRIAKAVLVIDEAQDMDKNEFALVRALMRANEELRVIAVGDDDQNIYAFRGADSRYMGGLSGDGRECRYELVENYRSCRAIVDFANALARKIRRRMKTRPGVAVRKERGTVQVVRHSSENMVVPVVDEVKRTWHGESACVLTRTNDEAAQMAGALSRAGIPAQLIQSVDGFRFPDLAEVRHFFRRIDKKTTSPVIGEEQWEEAKKETLSRYGKSDCIDCVRRFFGQFESVHRTKYLSDLREFAFESKLEDFCAGGSGRVFVSTIHKAKGREFDTVYMMLGDEKVETDEAKRSLYVGMTRAKDSLFIHCNTDVFEDCRTEDARFLEDLTPYSEPPEIRMQLSLRDVWLDFAKGKKDSVFKLQSGSPLRYISGYLRADSGVNVAALSTGKREELKAWESKGYFVCDAKVGFIVAWKGQGETEEAAVVLPTLTLRKGEGKGKNALQKQGE